MFKTWKENRNNKRDILFYQAFLLQSLAEIVVAFKKSQEVAEESGISEKDAIEIMKNLKGVDQKEMLSKIVESIKPTEKAE